MADFVTNSNNSSSTDSAVQSNSTVFSSDASSVTTSSNASSEVTSVQSSASSNASENSSANEVEGSIVPASELPADQRGTFSPVDSRTANVEFTEKDGTKLKIQFQAPDLATAEEISDKQFAFRDENGEQVMNVDSKSFHQALFKIMGTIIVTPADGGDKEFAHASWDFFDKHREAYHYIIGKAVTFYNAD